MGLLLGASAVTIVEVVDFLIVSLTSGYEPQHDDDDVENTGEKRRRSTKLRRATGCNGTGPQRVGVRHGEAGGRGEVGAKEWGREKGDRRRRSFDRSVELHKATGCNGTGPQRGGVRHGVTEN